MNFLFGGEVCRANGVLPICIEAAKLGMKRIILPKENSIEAIERIINANIIKKS